MARLVPPPTPTRTRVTQAPPRLGAHAEASLPGCRQWGSQPQEQEHHLTAVGLTWGLSSRGHATAPGKTGDATAETRWGEEAPQHREDPEDKNPGPRIPCRNTVLREPEVSPAQRPAAGLVTPGTRGTGRRDYHMFTSGGDPGFGGGVFCSDCNCDKAKGRAHSIPFLLRAAEPRLTSSQAQAGLRKAEQGRALALRALCPPFPLPTRLEHLSP